MIKHNRFPAKLAISNYAKRRNVGVRKPPENASRKVRKVREVLKTMRSLRLKISSAPRHLEKTFGCQQAGSLLGKVFSSLIKRGENLF